MTKRSFWRLVGVLGICGACAFFFLPLSKVRLGLDLRGGVRFDLEVQSEEALDSDLRDNRDRIQDRLKEKGVLGARTVKEDGILRVEGFSSDQKGIVQKSLETINGYDVKFDDKGARLTQTAAYQQMLKEDAGKRALQIVDNRVNQFGVSEAEITPSGKDNRRIVVELPGISEAERERIKDLLMTPGRLEQRIMAKQDPTHGAGFATKEEGLAQFQGVLPDGLELVPELESDRDLRKAGKEVPKRGKKEEKIKRWYLTEEKVYCDGADITDSFASAEPSTGLPEVHFTLNSKGGEDFYQLTKLSTEEERMIVILLDRKVVSVLRCNQAIAGGSVRITGRFTREDVEDFASKLKSGAMRASIKVLEEKTVGPSLGTDSIKSGVFASVLGFGMIIAFMLIYYKWSGFNALIALTVNCIVMMGLLGSFKAVFTLPGIAGFILSLGMAVDANILIFERIREELANGKSVSGAIQAGFDRVFWTIVDSHMTQLFSALLLFIFGTGPVKGFAVTLTVGVVASLFTSIYISRFIYDWVLERQPGTKTLSI